MSQQKHRQQLTDRRGQPQQRYFTPRVTKAQQSVLQARQTPPPPPVTEISPQVAGDLQPVQPGVLSRLPFSKLQEDFVKRVNDEAWEQIKAAADEPLLAEQDPVEQDPVEQEPEQELASEVDVPTEPVQTTEPAMPDYPETDDGPLLEFPAVAEYET